MLCSHVLCTAFTSNSYLVGFSIRFHLETNGAGLTGTIMLLVDVHVAFQFALFHILHRNHRVLRCRRHPVTIQSRPRLSSSGNRHVRWQYYMYVSCVLLTSNCCFYSSTSSTSSFRANNWILDIFEYMIRGHKPATQRNRRNRNERKQRTYIGETIEDSIVPPRTRCGRHYKTNERNDRNTRANRSTMKETSRKLQQFVIRVG